MAQKKIRFGIIGCGLMGREFASATARWCHLQDIGTTPEIVAISDTNPAAFEWFTGNFSAIHQTSTNYNDLLTNPEVDAVYCAIPHHLHHPCYTETIQAGKHLLGEKPFGIDLAANAAILSPLKAHPNLVVRCSSQFPYFPGVQRIVRMAGEKRFGRIIEIEAGFLHSSDLDPRKQINWKRMVEINGEYGCMGDLALHTLHVPLRLGFMPKNVRAILSNIVPMRPNARGEMTPSPTWDNATLLCEIADSDYSFPMTIKTHRIAPGETNTWYLSIKGVRNSARFSTKYPKTLETMPYEPGSEQTWHREDLGYASVYPTITGSIFEFGFSDAIMQMIASFCEQISLGPNAEVPFGCVTPEETRLQHLLLTAALASHRDRATTALPE